MLEQAKDVYCIMFQGEVVDETDDKRTNLTPTGTENYDEEIE